MNIVAIIIAVGVFALFCLFLFGVVNKMGFFYQKKY